MHLLKNGHPAHVFTVDDRRKAAAVTNEIRREKRSIVERERLNQELERMRATDAARRQREAAKERRRREEKKRLAAFERPFRYEPTYRDDAPAGTEVGPIGPVAPVEERPRPFDSGRYDWP
jgi:hypothetical protein